MSGAPSSLLRRPAAQRWLLVRAVLTLTLMRLAIRLPFRFVSRIMGLRRGETPLAVDVDTLAHAVAVSWAVGAAASRAPWQSTCLVQGLTATVLLRRRGIAGTLYLGVAKDGVAPEGMSAHAWVRCGDLLVTGEAERERYTPVASFASK